MSTERSERIAVTVLTGFLGAGKTTLLNRVLRQPEQGRALVIVNEWGEIGIDHHLIRHIDDRVAVVAGGCMCCTVRGALVDTLRDMFMRALRKDIPMFDRVWIEASGMAEAAPVLFSLRYAPFLAQRFVFAGCVAVVDVVDLAARLQRFPVMRRQIVEADVVAFSKHDQVEGGQALEAEEVVAALNAWAPCVSAQDTDAIGRALVVSRDAPMGRRAPGVTGWLTPSTMRPDGMRQAHGDVRAWSFRTQSAWRRGAFLAAMDDCLQALGDRALRAKGIVALVDADGVTSNWVVHAVHTTLYPMSPAPPKWSHGTVLVFIADGAGESAVEAVDARLRALDA